MKIKLPIQEKEIIEKDNGELEIKKNVSEKEFELDMTINSQMRFEIKFPELAKNENLLDYSKRIKNIHDDLKNVNEMTLPIIISELKLLYCWFDTEISFNEFLKIFDLTDIEYIKNLTDKLKKVFELIFNSSAEKN